MTHEHQLVEVNPVDVKPKRKLSFEFSFAEILAIVLICAQVAWYVNVWFHIIGDPSLKRADFISFYEAGRLIMAGQYSNIYDFNSEMQFQRQFFDDKNVDPLRFNHPPYLTPIYALVASDNYVFAYIYWSFLSLLVVFGCGRLIYLYLLRSEWSRRSAWLATLGSITYFPIFISLYIGQDTVFTLLGLLVWMFALLQRKEIYAGLGLAFATLTPTIAGALALPLFASRRRSGVWFVIGALVLAVYSFFLVKFQGIMDFLSSLQASSEGRSFGINWVNMYNLFGLLIRAFPGLSIEVIRSIVWASTVLSLFAVCIFWWNKREHLTIKHIGIAVVLGTFTSPHLHLHGLTYLLLPLLALITMLHDRGNKAIALIFIPVVSFVLIVARVKMPPDWYYSLVYLIMFVMFICFVALKPSAMASGKH